VDLGKTNDITFTKKASSLIASAFASAKISWMEQNHGSAWKLLTINRVMKFLVEQRPQQ
jgi:hypothetical protein